MRSHVCRKLNMSTEFCSHMSARSYACLQELPQACRQECLVACLQKRLYTCLLDVYAHVYRNVRTHVPTCNIFQRTHIGCPPQDAVQHANLCDPDQPTDVPDSGFASASPAAYSARGMCPLPVPKMTASLTSGQWRVGHVCGYVCTHVRLLASFRRRCATCGSA